MIPPQVYTCFSSWTPLPSPSLHHPLGHSSVPASSILYHALNLDCWFVSHMIICMFQCHSPKSSHPCLLPQNPKDCSIHLCLFCYLAYRVIITAFLNSIYMHYYTVLMFFFLTYFTLSHASNLDWQSISHICFNAILSNHPTLAFSQSPKVCSLYLSLFCYLTYRVIVLIFLNSIYMC